MLGAYGLTGVNGTKPPGVYVLTPSGQTMLDTATIRLTAGGTYSDIRTTRTIDATGTKTATNTRTGTFEISGNTVTFAFTDVFGAAKTETATVSGKVITKTEGTVTLTLTKK
jgi:hypothetical protein